MAAPAAFAEPQAGESYCVGIEPEHCPYHWALDGNRWHYDGIPLGREESQEDRRRREDRREDAPGRLERVPRIVLFRAAKVTAENATVAHIERYI